MPRSLLSFAALSVLALATLAGCGEDLQSPSRVQDCNGERYLVPSSHLTGTSNGGGGCLLRNGLMPQPQQFS